MQPLQKGAALNLIWVSESAMVQGFKLIMGTILEVLVYLRDFRGNDTHDCMRAMDDPYVFEDKPTISKESGASSVPIW